MKILHIFKTEPDDTTKTLVNILSEGKEANEFELFKEEGDSDNLLDLIFKHDKVIIWWYCHTRRSRVKQTVN